MDHGDNRMMPEVGADHPGKYYKPKEKDHMVIIDHVDELHKHWVGANFKDSWSAADVQTLDLLVGKYNPYKNWKHPLENIKDPHILQRIRLKMAGVE